MSDNTRNWTALGVYVTFLVVAFGWRTWLQWRRTGDSGLRTNAIFGTVEWWAKLAFVVAITAGLAAPIGGLLGVRALPVLDAAALQVAGLFLAVFGVAATTWAQWQMGNSWRIGVDPEERTALVDQGIFAFVRNPIFTFMLMTAIGLAFVVGNVIALVGLVVLLVALEVQVRVVEEPYLMRTHGADYRTYARSVGRFMPGIGKVRQTR